MHIILSPQRRDDALTLGRQGDVLVINGDALDFSALGEGDLLPREAVDHPFVVSDVERVDGRVTLTLILPHGAGASQAARFPADIIDPPDGPVEVPT